MVKIHDIFYNLSNNIPMALVRINDGEAEAILNPGCTIARGDQKVNNELSDALKEAIQHEQENYWIGLPCEHCNTSKWYHKIKHLVKPDYPYLTKAVVTTNRNWKFFVETFTNIAKKNKIYWVSGEDQDISKLDFDIYHHITVPTKDAWSVYNNLKKMSKLFDDGSIVCLSCGPMSRVLAYNWFKNNPKVSFLDIGSAFDPYTRNVWHNCHKGTLAKCKGCN